MSATRASCRSRARRSRRRRTVFPPVRADPDPGAPRGRRGLRARGQGAAHGWRAGGIMVQFLPASPERARRPTFRRRHPRARWDADDAAEDDAWLEAQALLDTVEDHELIDPALVAERLLYRLFHERGVRVFQPTRSRTTAPARASASSRCFVRWARRRSRKPPRAARSRCAASFAGREYSFDPAAFRPVRS